MSTSRQFDITGNWTPADSTKNTLEIAQTDREDIVALRDSYDPQNVLFTTKNHVRNLAESAQKGPMKNLVR